MNPKIDPSTLKITDMRFADIDGAPKRCTLLKIYTNQGITGYGEVRDASSRTYAAMLKSRILGENPCNVEKIFRRIKQFGGDSRQAGGVCGIEVALWDIAGKAWGVPVWQLLGGKYRDRIRIYCDTDSEGGGRDMGKALKDRMAQGYTFLKMDLGIELLMDVPGALSAPLGFLEKMREYKQTVFSTPHGSIDPRAMRGEAYDLFNTAHPFTGIHITEKGLDYLEKYMADCREVTGYEIPIAIDHLGHIPLEDCIKLAKRLEKFNLAWMEDPVPWQMTSQYVRLANSTTTPVGTGEDMYLKESFKPLFESGALAVVHPDVLTAGGILETKKIGDMAEEFEQYQRFDEDSAEQVREVLRHRELTPIEVCCRIDKFGRMTIEANICRTHGVHINKGQLTREISGACGRTFTQPSVTAAGDTLKLQMCQKPVYAVQRGFAQHAANGASLCGDCAEAFTDGSGRYISVLSDGQLWTAQ